MSSTATKEAPTKVESKSPPKAPASKAETSEVAKPKASGQGVIQFALRHGGTIAEIRKGIHAACKASSFEWALARGIDELTAHDFRYTANRMGDEGKVFMAFDKDGESKRLIDVKGKAALAGVVAIRS